MILQRWNMWRETLRVIINNHLYDMTRKQSDGVLKVASEQIPFGIYAVEKDGIIELRKDKCKSKVKLRELIQQFKSKGFKVYSNGS